MSARRLKVGIRTKSERSRAVRNVLERVAHGDRTPRQPELYFESVEELRRILTQKRLELILAISHHEPKSVHELAGHLGRDYKNVASDITLLKRLGLVVLESKGGRGGAQIPRVPYDEMQVTIVLRQLHAARAA